MKVVLASKNKHKIKELETLLSKYVEDIEILSLDEVGIVDDIVEDGSTFAENALIKARAAASSGYIGVGDDSGLCVKALGGAPGIYSARYAGDHGNDAANNEKLLRELSGKSERGASFMCAIACVFPDGRSFVAEGKADGVILESARGEGGFGYDPLFYYEELHKTFSELTAEEKNSVSHRGRAILAFAEEFSKRI